ncbi:hypothetical protein ACF09C_30100 [Streptomyces sp. NPDC014870]|uniref:hypothetical protein n=1 Tax=Streptomyces sp. NPDC014870 TaxID=3364925 RepID=UPI0036F64634
MTLTEGRRVTLAEDLRLTGHVTRADGARQDADSAAGFLALGAGLEGIVERVTEHGRVKNHEVREYERLTSLFDDFGHQMPPGSRQQLQEQIASLVPAWNAYRDQAQRVTVRVRLDNGFVLDEAPVDAFTLLCSP